ncbi:hypothetical protein F4808DRAFT_423041, partial [Astrocystis sublimbata]
MCRKPASFTAMSSSLLKALLSIRLPVNYHSRCCAGVTSPQVGLVPSRLVFQSFLLRVTLTSRNLVHRPVYMVSGCTLYFKLGRERMRGNKGF